MKKGAVFLAFLLVFIFQNNAYAHPGRTDANGGHTCHTNCAKWGLKDGQYHYHNGGGASTTPSKPAAPAPKPKTSTPPATNRNTGDKDCSDFSSYDEVVEYWNKKGYSKTYDPERLDGFGNKVDDGIPCEAPDSYDLSKVNNSDAQIAKNKEKQDKASGAKAGYDRGLADGSNGKQEVSSTKGSDAYRSAYEESYLEGYEKGQDKLNSIKEDAEEEGYKLGGKDSKLNIPWKFSNIALLKSAFTQGFNKARTEQVEKKKEQFMAMGIKDGQADTSNSPSTKEEELINAYEDGYKKGQKKLKEVYVKKGYQAAFSMVNYKAPKLKKLKYEKWYKEGFKSNLKVTKIAKLAYNAGINGGHEQVPSQYKQAEKVWTYNYNKGVTDNKEGNNSLSSLVGLGFVGWLGRRYYVAKKMLK